MRFLSRLAPFIASICLVALPVYAQDAGVAVAPAAAVSIGSATAPTAMSPAAAPVQMPGAAQTTAGEGAPKDGQSAAEQQAAAEEPTSNPAGPEQVRRTEFQDFIAQSTGRDLPLFGYNLFRDAPSTFAPVDRVPVPADYVIGPGDELVLRAWGQIDMEHRAVVDRNGHFYIPKVGNLNVAGLKSRDLNGFLKSAIGRVFKNFELNTTLGQLRSIQIFVVGHAKRPGNYTVSSLSTLVNALFASGGPAETGSMRRIQLKRSDKVIAEFDLYDLLVRGDKSKDAQLLPGDVIFIPPAGKMVAISGSVNIPAIYEIKDRTNLNELISLSGGLTTTAAGQKVTVERIQNRQARKVAEFELDAPGLARPLLEGDLVTVYSISPRFDNAVSLRGNVASPLRLPWREGMRVSDLLADKNTLVATAYWERQNRGTVYPRHTRREVNWDYATVQRLNEADLTTRLYAFNLGKAIQGNPADNLVLRPGDIVTVYSSDETPPKTENDITLEASFIGGTRRFVWRQGIRLRDLIPSAQWLIDYYDYWRNLKDGVQAQINWDYASIVRQHPAKLDKSLIAFNLGEAVMAGNPEHNLTLMPGDEIRLFTKDEFAIPGSKQKRLVKLEGEVAIPGIYQVEEGETLRQLLTRIGGLTPEAYLYGAEFTRESTRAHQQKMLDETLDRLQESFQRSTAQRSQNVTAPEEATALKAEAASQQALLARMRQVRATGRITFELPKQEAKLKDLPEIALQDGDRLLVPTLPSAVHVLGSVYSPGSFMYESGRSVSDYLAKAGGPTRDADEDSLYVIEANGAVSSKRQSGWLLGSLGGSTVTPGATLVVPEETEKTTFMTKLKDWTQVLFQFGLGAAALKTIR